MRKLLVAVALTLALVSPVTADVVTVYKSSISTTVINHDTGKTTIVFGDPEDVSTVVTIDSEE